VISGRLREGVSLEQAEAEIDAILNQVVQQGVTAEELEKVKNQAYATLEFGEVEVMNRAMNLAFASLSGDTALVNEEGSRIEAVTQEQIQRVAAEIFKEESSSVMYYHAVQA
jgi:zinc protease